MARFNPRAHVGRDVERFKTRQSPLTCRHRHRCHDEPTEEASEAPDTTLAASPRRGVQTLGNGWRKLAAAILDTLRD